MHRDQRVGRVIAERCRERDFLLGRRARRRDVGRAELRDELLRQPLDQRGAIRLARLDDLHQRRPAERLDAEERRRGRPSAPCLRALSASAFQNTKAPDTAHSPGSAARSNTNVSDGSSRMVRSSFMCAVRRVFGSSHDGAASAGMSCLRSASTLPTRRTSRSPFSSMSRRTPLLARQALQILLRDRAEAVFLPGVDVHHQVAREAFDQLGRRDVGEAFLLQRRRQRVEARARRRSSRPCGSSRRTPASPAARPRARPAARRAVRRRPARHRRGSRPASRSRPAFPAAHRRAARRPAPPCPYRCARRAVRSGSSGSSTTANSARSKRPDIDQRSGALLAARSRPHARRHRRPPAASPA